ncbi:glycosyltransferase family 87 protein [Thermogemmatispora onikobensis]|uniref:glycosyltransferase family 87 protein n=1 Tax=Thermogemmatispora onikobensis TaxID=732234 RepID=UPI000853A8D1|nr:glycosyltransferase family 87 protein [Thermogemmatispora onikobensis]
MAMRRSPLLWARGLRRWPAPWLLFLPGTMLFLESAWQVFLAPTDLLRYQCYALLFWFGSAALHWLPAQQCTFLPLHGVQPPFHVLPQEYPPLTLVPFSLPLLVPLPYYTLTFALLMLGVAAALVWLLYRFVSPQAALGGTLLLIVGGGPLLQVRYDLLPSLCVLACLVAARRERWALAYLALAGGTLLKLYPLVGLPALFLAEQQSLSSGQEPLPRIAAWRWRHLLLFGATVALVSAFFALLNPTGALLEPLRYFSQRPPQIESLAASLLWLSNLAAFGQPLQLLFSYGSLNVVSPLAPTVSLLLTCLLCLGLLLTLWLQYKGVFDLWESMLALLLLLITTGKVFSPQYLLWVIPVVVGATLNRTPSSRARSWRLLWIVICLLTSSIYVFYYPHLADPTSAPQVAQTLPGFFEIILLRNVLVLAATLGQFGFGLLRSL